MVVDVNNDFKKSVVVYHTLMVKHLYTLALRALRTNQEVSTHLTRIQHGFLPDKNIIQAQEVIQELQHMLSEMQEAIRNPEKQNSNHIVPLK